MFVHHGNRGQHSSCPVESLIWKVEGGFSDPKAWRHNPSTRTYGSLEDASDAQSPYLLLSLSISPNSPILPFPFIRLIIPCCRYICFRNVWNVGRQQQHITGFPFEKVKPCPWTSVLSMRLISSRSFMSSLLSPTVPGDKNDDTRWSTQKNGWLPTFTCLCDDPWINIFAQSISMPFPLPENKSSLVNRWE